MKIVIRKNGLTTGKYNVTIGINSSTTQDKAVPRTPLSPAFFSCISWIKSGSWRRKQESISTNKSRGGDCKLTTFPLKVIKLEIVED